MSHIDQYFEDAIAILKKIDKGQIEKMIEILLNVRKHQGRLFLLGVGGSAGNCIHAVNDFRKLAWVLKPIVLPKILLRSLLGRMMKDGKLYFLNG